MLPQPTDPPTTQQRIFALYDLLRQHFSHEPHWWPLQTAHQRFEILVGAVLVQQTRWETVEGAIRRIDAAGWLAPAALAAADTTELAALIRPCAFHTQKAPGLQTICRFLVQRWDGDLRALLAQEPATLRAELLALPRIGPETADTIMVYAGGHPAFIADAYARRLFARVDLVPGFDFTRARYDAIRELVEHAVADAGAEDVLFDLPAPAVEAQAGLCTFYREFHALINEACIHHCLASKPRCDQRGARRPFLDPRKCAAHCLDCSGCPLRPMCVWHQHHSAGAVEGQQ